MIIFKDVLFLIVNVLGLVMLFSSVFLRDWNLCNSGMLFIIMSHLNDVENKLDKKEKQ